MTTSIESYPFKSGQAVQIGSAATRRAVHFHAERANFQTSSPNHQIHAQVANRAKIFAMSSSGGIKTTATESAAQIVMNIPGSLQDLFGCPRGSAPTSTHWSAIMTRKATSALRLAVTLEAVGGQPPACNIPETDHLAGQKLRHPVSAPAGIFARSTTVSFAGYASTSEQGSITKASAKAPGVSLLAAVELSAA